MPAQKDRRQFICLALRHAKQLLTMMLIVLPYIVEPLLGSLADFYAPIFRNSRVRVREDVFTLDRLIDSAANIGITVRMTATRPYGNG